MKIKSFLLFLSLVLLQESTGQLQDYSKPFVRWWWPGNAVDSVEIAIQLDAFAKAGIGGVEIIPIYGVKGAEKKFIPYMSPRFRDMVQFTIEEAKRYGITVDMTLGSGWPFGGPWVEPEHAAKKIDFTNMKLSGTGQMVKRACPGGEGLVIDHLSKPAILDFLSFFDSAAFISKGNIRAVFNDSYEAYGANWTGNFSEEFEKRMGYKLENQKAFFSGTLTGEDAERVLHDYRMVLSELILQSFALPLKDWASGRGVLVKSQSHGSPGNLLDLYAAADIPETEIFGSSRFPVPGLRRDEGHTGINADPDHLVMKMASSAAHLAGKDLVSCETGTWLGEHFRVSLSQLKPEVDQLFAAGINHIFYHGICYSPHDEPWPGWQFYAATDFSPRSALWSDLPEMNRYISNCQEILQHSKPANEVLVYFPFHDLISRINPAKPFYMFEVQNANEWIRNTPLEALDKQITAHGCGYDFFSDTQLSGFLCTEGKIKTAAGNVYEALVIPPLKYIPQNSLEKLLQLAEDGARIYFPASEMGLPGKVGEENDLQNFSMISEKMKVLAEGGGTSYSVADKIDLSGIQPSVQEPPASLRYLRKKEEGKELYFFVNLGGSGINTKLKLKGEFRHARVYDPLTDKEVSQTITPVDGYSPVWINLAPGESVFVFCEKRKARETTFVLREPDTLKSLVPSKWLLTFRTGVPSIQESLFPDPLQSWTSLGIPELNRYSGYGEYQTVFNLDLAEEYCGCLLRIDGLHETAGVSLNGEYLGKIWCLPNEMFIPRAAFRSVNHLVLEVKNLDANRIADMDRRKVNWKKFYDINFVNLAYKPFDASAWKPFPSGICGKVEIIPVRCKQPE